MRVTSPQWGSRCARGVRNFRNTLSPDDAAAFDECLVGICRDPRTDDIRKFPHGWGPLTSFCLYQDNQFAVLYDWEPVEIPDEEWGFPFLVHVRAAAYTTDYEKDPMVLWKWWLEQHHGTAM